MDVDGDTDVAKNARRAVVVVDELRRALRAAADSGAPLPADVRALLAELASRGHRG